MYPRDNRGLTRRLISESSALLEIGSNFALLRRLQKFVPDGDGHPVLLIPGFTASDASMKQLQKFLNNAGYAASSWGLGRNKGLHKDYLERLKDKVAGMAEEFGGQVSVIGWSGGGMYARGLSHEIPDMIRQVITMGSPFKLTEDTLDHLPEAIYKFHDRLSPREELTDELDASAWGASPPVPSTSLFSKRDGLAPWAFCLDHRDEQSENVQVAGSHAGMTFNPLMYYVIADRLAQPADNWRHFEPQVWLRPWFGKACASEFHPQPA